MFHKGNLRLKANQLMLSTFIVWATFHPPQATHTLIPRLTGVISPQYCHVGRLSHEVGWKYREVVRKLEDKRKFKAIHRVAYERKLKVGLLLLWL